MITKMVTTDNEIATWVRIDWDIKQNILYTSSCGEEIAYTLTEAAQLRDFLNQLPLTNPLTKEK